MLISFSVSNWRLFREEVSFSMLASAEKQNKEHIARIPGVGTKVLPVAVIYGGNASGKSSLIKALAFVQHFIITGAQIDSLILTEPFNLDSKNLHSPSHFKVQMIVDEKCYEYSFVVTRKKVIEETLIQILKTTEKELYKRKNGKIKFHQSLYSSAKEEQFLEFVFRGTRENQLFLTNTVNQKLNSFKLLYDWYKNSLSIVIPESQFMEFDKFMEDSGTLSKQINQILPLLDTGILKLSGKDVLLESMNLPPLLMDKIKELGNKKTLRIKINNDMYVIRNNDGAFSAKKLMAVHHDIEDNEVFFDIRDESDGTRRCIDLLPLFIDLVDPKSTKVYVIDELDRSLHNDLIIEMLRFFLQSCKANKRSQLIFSTHNLLTMDQELLRRDEMWATERTDIGSAKLISFGEYKDIRKDKHIRKSYLQGRLGGLPNIQLHEADLK